VVVAAQCSSAQVVVPAVAVSHSDLGHTNGRVTETSPAIEVRDLHKDYHLASNVVHALRGVSLRVMPGEFVAVMGPSGSGKSTFMNLIGCLDRPTSGAYLLDGVDVTSLSPDKLAELRGSKLGFIFQGFNLLPRMDALENVMLPMMYGGVSGHERHERARAALQAVGLVDRANHRPSELSGGQQQRVAIARSLVNAPSVILADEPTGNLDSRTSIEIMGILQALNQAGATIVLVTHEPDIAGYCSRTVAFKDGLVVSDQPNRQIVSAADVMSGWPASDEESA
jgi:putative ABC transport system ATP-binding protein